MYVIVVISGCLFVCLFELESIKDVQKKWDHTFMISKTNISLIFYIKKGIEQQQKIIISKILRRISIILIN